MNLQPLADALRCGLSGKLMSDPVIVVSTDSADLHVGSSYERAELEQWKAGHGEAKLRFVDNPSLRAMTVVYGRLALVPAVETLVLN